MNWNFETGRFLVRLPITDQDGDLLYGLLKDRQVGEHIPRAPLYASVQSLDELRRATMRFQAREAAIWLVMVKEGNVDEMAALKARVTLQNINWMLLSAQLQWELAADLPLNEFTEIREAIEHFCVTELGLHRLEVRLRPGSAPHTEWLQGAGYQYEGCLPAQLEFDGEWVDLALYSRLAPEILSA